MITVKFSKEQINKICSLIKQGKTKYEIAEYFNISEPTLRKKIKEYNIILPNVKRTTKKKFKPNKAQLKYIKRNISKKNKNEIAKYLEISMPTFNNILVEYNIDTSNYQRKNPKKVNLSEEQINQLDTLLKSHYTYDSIARKMSINRNMIKEFIKRYNLNVNNVAALNSDYTAIIIEMYKTGFSINDISLMINVPRDTISDTLNNNNIKIIKTRYISIDDNTKLKYINRIKSIQKTYYSSEKDFNSEEILYIKNNIKNIPAYVIAKNLNRYEDEVNFIIHKYRFGAKYLTYENIFNLPFGKEFEKDLCNPELTHTTVARKYGIGATSIRTWRQKRYKDFKTRINIWMNKTTAEIVFEKILDELDLVYCYQKQIGKYKFDYYLGKKCVIEIQGNYWHSLEKNIKNDLNKKSFCEKNHYNLLYVWESELKDSIKLKKKINDFCKENIKF